MQNIVCLTGAGSLQGPEDLLSGWVREWPFAVSPLHPLSLQGEHREGVLIVPGPVEALLSQQSQWAVYRFRARFATDGP